MHYKMHAKVAEDFGEEDLDDHDWGGAAEEHAEREEGEGEGDVGVVEKGGRVRRDPGLN